ncbi:MAG: deoxyribodipyrimidine photo-lyase [bacterium]|nr:deoxyribodipyrimidine photo-lyase [bacterium]MDA1024338.1 deoxyribodipyrimidine photo-lyase [bacterium]
MNEKRVRQLNTADYKGGIIVYWMDRDERYRHNHALLYAGAQAKEHNAPLVVVFNLVVDFLSGGMRQFDFKRRGLRELQDTFIKHGIAFTILLTDDSPRDLLHFFQEVQAGMVVTDFSPLRIQRTWKRAVKKELKIPFFEVDAHNIVPVWEVSEKKEFAAYTIRKKIHTQLPEFLVDYPRMPEVKTIRAPKTDWEAIQNVKLDGPDIVDTSSGERAAHNTLRRFIASRLDGYAEKRNDPNEEALSGLSPYLHYGQISPQYVALSVRGANAPLNDREAFLEELIVRRELADNFCYYEPKYDAFEGFHEWARKSLDEHRKDKREYVYTRAQFEKAKTHDNLWNAAQREVVDTGKMHGYMRMYWAKKILEWTESPEDALKIAIYLNDKYELDGRDPNGYVGIAWSIGGVHDRAWNERPIFGKVRYMNANGAKRKFDTEGYIRRFLGEDKFI